MSRAGSLLENVRTSGDLLNRVNYHNWNICDDGEEKVEENVWALLDDNCLTPTTDKILSIACMQQGVR